MHVSAVGSTCQRLLSKKYGLLGIFNLHRLVLLLATSTRASEPPCSLSRGNAEGSVLILLFCLHLPQSGESERIYLSRKLVFKHRRFLA